VRDINLKYNASKLVNFDVIRNVILRGNKEDEHSPVVNVREDKKIIHKRAGGENEAFVTEAEDNLKRI